MDFLSPKKDGLACSRLASRRREQREEWLKKRCVHGPKSECPPRAPMAERDPTGTEVRARMMKVLIGVDPHKAAVAVAVVDEVVGEFVESATFAQNRAGLRDLQRSKRNGSPSVVRRWRTLWRSRGRHLAGRLAAAGEESVVDVPPKLSARVRVLSRAATPARTMSWTPSPPRSGRLAQRAASGGGSRDRLRGAAPPFGEARRSGGRAYPSAQSSLHGLLRDLLPGGVSGTLSVHRAARILRGIRPQGTSARLRRRLASEVLRDIRTLERKIASLNEGIEAEVEASGTTLT